jgi:hypothetical protein
MRFLMNDLIGKSYKFEDGDTISIVQIKVRDGGEKWITYHVQQGPGIPRKLVMRQEEFVDTYGHLFGIISDDKSDITEE